MEKDINREGKIKIDREKERMGESKKKEEEDKSKR